MEKKILKIVICLLIIPVLISLIISIITGNKQNYVPNVQNNKENKYVYNEPVKVNSAFIYISVFTLVIVGVGVWAYVKKKGNV